MPSLARYKLGGNDVNDAIGSDWPVQSGVMCVCDRGNWIG